MINRLIPLKIFICSGVNYIAIYAFKKETYFVFVVLVIIKVDDLVNLISKLSYLKNYSLYVKFTEFLFKQL